MAYIHIKITRTALRPFSIGLGGNRPQAFKNADKALALVETYVSGNHMIDDLAAYYRLKYEAK